ncbi:MAG: translation initiation factor IF-2 [Alphaproteobacteria bacterium]|jgi:translation initiation factor IF-2|nr:translation initiation factor IF-2 [Alphaproteobacteria bacterium]MDP6812326.1 translation initiation factor IF-2 [Alphaproteobacteria bacterium]
MGGRKTVTVEVRRSRSVSRSAAQPVAEALTPVKEAPPAEVQLVEPSPPAGAEAASDTRTRHVLRTLSDEEKVARARALDNARAADEAARARAEENAQRRAVEEARLATEREAAEERRKEEENRKRVDEEARRKSEEEAERKLREKDEQAEQSAAAVAAEKGAPVRRAVRPAEAKAEEEAGRPRRGGERPKPTPRARTEPRRRRGRLTVSDALSDREERMRSLASMKRERERRKQQMAGAAEPPAKVVREVVVPETITVQELANRMAERGVDVVRTLMGMGVMATVNQTIDADTAELVVAEFGHNLRRVSEADVEIGLKGADDMEEDLETRPPVVTVMGHVDHGKTSLLDAIREADVVSGEAGGITQHIGAYQVVSPSGGKITFVDTPGHEAFTSMRARGAQVTDVVVLVVAADDGVMPQTVEAINHAKAAEVPIIVAINKMDLPNANPNRVKQELLQHEVIAEEMGGDVQIVEVSAVKKQNLDGLEEIILLQSELLELQANPERLAEGVVIEAQLDRGRGAVATVLVQRGTLNVGDVFVAGAHWGKVRALIDSHGDNIDSAGPSMPVEVLGLNGAPGAGDEFAVVENEARAREVADYRQRVERDRRAVSGARGSLEQMFDKIQAGEQQEFPLVVKTDVQGSLEAIIAAVEKLNTDEVSARVLHAGVGGITESDIDLARASDAVVIGFNVRANAQAREMARHERIEIRYYSIIYELVDDLRKAMSGLLAPEIRETVIGGADVLEVFNVSKVGKIAGCRINTGLARRNARIRLLRDSVVIHEGGMRSLKRFKDDTNEVREGNECGVALENYQDIQPGDQLEFFEVEEIERSL